MLVVTRLKDQAVRIGPAVAVIVRQCGQESVRLEVVLPAGMALVGPQGSCPREAVEGGQARGCACLREGQRLHIGEEISVSAWPRKHNSHRIYLGVEAPRSLVVIRDDGVNNPPPPTV